MANREENLKKINDELEKLDDEQLEQVAGGILGILGRKLLKLDKASDANTQASLDPLGPEDY